MKLLALFPLGLIASSASAAPLEKRSANTCVSTLTGMSTMTCNCLATCTQADTCCTDYDTFKSQFLAFTSPPSIAPPVTTLPSVVVGRMPEFHKSEPAVTAATSGPNGSTLLTIRNCVFEDQLKVPYTGPNDGKLAVMPKWVVKECTPGYDVIAMTAQGTFSPFTTAVKVPKTVRVAVGAANPEPTDPVDANLYYAQVSGASAEAAYKMALTNERPVAGFTAQLARSASAGKLAFDATPRRTWRVAAATLSTTHVHEMAAPEVDVSAGMLDKAGEFDRVAKAADYRVTPLRGGLLRLVFDDKRKAWVSVVDREGRRVVPQTLGA